MLLIANDGPLGPEWLDHPLSGEWAGHRECHIGGDFLLAYKLDESAKPGLIVFVRAGTHADLFELGGLLVRAGKGFDYRNAARYSGESHLINC